MKEKTSLILGEIGSVKVLNENKKDTQIDGFMEHDDGTLEAVDFYGED